MNVIVVIGTGSIGQAIARRVSAGKHVLLADLHQGNADTAGKTLSDAGFDVSTATVDVSSRASVEALVQAATAFGEVSGLIHAAGVSPTQAPPEVILKVHLYGTALVLEEFGNVIARGGAGIVIASQSGHRLPPLSSEENAALATTPVEELLNLSMLRPDQVTDPLHAYQLSKRGNSLRVMAEEASSAGVAGDLRDPLLPIRQSPATKKGTQFDGRNIPQHRVQAAGCAGVDAPISSKTSPTKPPYPAGRHHFAPADE
jgi:NAD(P)-dependent dehydrogenase (short-subunit alcohol dehydrogenase family)